MVKLTFIGDIMCDRLMIKAAETGSGEKVKYDFSRCFAGVERLFAASDLVIGNLETPISIDNTGLSEKNYSFSAPREFAQAVKRCGIGCVSTANNHCLDRGFEGIDSTNLALDEAGILHSGVFSKKEDRAPLLFTAGGLRLGLLSYTYGTNAYMNRNYLEKEEEWRVNLFQEQEFFDPLLRKAYFRRKEPFYAAINYGWSLLHPQYIGKSKGERRQKDERQMSALKEDLRKLRALKPDLTIFCMHIGGQYNRRPTGYTRKMTQTLLSEGINLVAGNHEHVIHGCETDGLSRNQFAFYCLGNVLGRAGISREPYGRLCDHSIACHIYVETENRRVYRVSFSVLRCIPSAAEGNLEVHPAFDLIRNGTDKLKRDMSEKEMKEAALLFSGKEVTEAAEEYTLWTAG